MSFVKSFFTVSGFTLLSRVMGFIRDILIAAIMGAGPLAEVFLVAFKLPNFFRRLFAEGAFNAAFVPMFAGRVAKDGQEVAKKFARKIFSVLFFSLLVITLLMQIFMPYVMYVLAPGFVSKKEQFDMAVELARVTFPYLIFISVASFFAAMLNSVGRFASYASAPILLSICMISALLFFVDDFETPAHALSWAVAVGGVVQLLWMLLDLKKSGMTFGFCRPKLDGEVRQFLRKLAPGAIGAGVMQINLWVDIVIGTFIPSAIAYLYYADRVNQLPLSIIGIAMSAALLPVLSKQIREDKSEESIHSQNRALEIVLFFTLPATAGLIFLAEPIISTLFERGEFGSDASLATAYAMIAYSVGLPAFVMVKIFSTSFFAHGDTKTPVRFAVIAMVTNLVLNISLVLLFNHLGLMAHVGIALATAFSSWLNVYMLCKNLLKDERFYFDDVFKAKIWRIIVSVLVMVGAIFSAEFVVSGNQVVKLIILISAGIIAYFASVHAFKIYEWVELKKFLRKNKS